MGIVDLPDAPRCAKLVTWTMPLEMAACIVSFLQAQQAVPIASATCCSWSDHHCSQLNQPAWQIAQNAVEWL
jgi:hypothetical protein